MDTKMMKKPSPMPGMDAEKAALKQVIDLCHQLMMEQSKPKAEEPEVVEENPDTDAEME